MNEIKVFEYESAKVRAAEVGDEPFFVAKDVCGILGIDNHRDAVSRLDEDERGSVIVDTLGGKQSVTAVNESGLYSLIITSRKPEAKAFKKWITSDVLPSIRKTGKYSIVKDMTSGFMVPRSFSEALRLAADQAEQIELMKPKVETAEALSRCDKNMCITNAAKHFGLHPKTQVYAYLRDRGYLTSKDLPSQEAIAADILEIRQNKCNDSEFRPQAVVGVSQLDKWRTWLVPRIVEWSTEEAAV